MFIHSNSNYVAISALFIIDFRADINISACYSILRLQIRFASAFTFNKGEVVDMKWRKMQGEMHLVHR